MYHPEAVVNRFKAISRAAALPEIRFHDIRYSYATAALQAGIPVKTVSSRLGHASNRITLDTYAHVMPGQRDRRKTQRRRSLP
jgi:integrase